MNNDDVMELEHVASFTSPEIDQWVENTRNKLSDEIKNELAVFFQQESLIGFIVLTFMIKKSAYTDIPDFINMLENSSVSEYYHSLLKLGGTTDETDNVEEPESVIQHLDKGSLSEEEKWKLTYLIYDVKRTKQRLIYLLKEICHLIPQKEMEKALERQEKMIHELKGESDQVDLSYFEGLWTSKSGEDVYLFPCYVLDVSHVIAPDTRLGFVLCVLGVRHIELLESKKDTKKSLEKLKILSDERRFEILRLLRKRARYGYELAQQLNISNSTISHHLSTLVVHHLIKAIRTENKIYYEINQYELQRIIDDLTMEFVD
ncbi:ArsR/SmtB family transcription factor [Salicibibacter kimchii]|uniref:ArsR/SmtB family transcription factor n=1 Tax=Salicibibacter kimchii TaxID=2099786 RepID=UPI0013581A7C|nr:winged helix-turn-helix domain-containing protein [Salicibibacter kimchii]